MALKKAEASFPPIFIANINGYKTREIVAIRFPEPGKFIKIPPYIINLTDKNEPLYVGILTLYFGLPTGVVPSARSSDHSIGIISSSVRSSVLYIKVAYLPDYCCRWIQPYSWFFNKINIFILTLEREVILFISYASYYRTVVKSTLLISPNITTLLRQIILNKNRFIILHLLL